jgi:hypothetical protein
MKGFALMSPITLNHVRILFAAKIFSAKTDPKIGNQAILFTSPPYRKTVRTIKNVNSPFYSTPVSVTQIRVTRLGEFAQ